MTDIEFRPRIFSLPRILLASLMLTLFAGATDLTPAQLEAALENAGVQRVNKAQTLSGSNAGYLLVYGLNSSAKPAIFIFRDDSLSSGRKGLRLDWQSGALPQELSVIAAGMPRVETMANHDVAILLSGCMPHSCGSKLGAIVYSIDRHELFKADYDSSVIPALKYSPNALVEKNSDYKKLLDSLLREHNVQADSK